MNEDKSTDHQPESLDVGFREKDPRYVHHQYELDRLFREWHSARDNNTALRIQKIFDLAADIVEEVIEIRVFGKRHADAKHSLIVPFDTLLLGHIPQDHQFSLRIAFPVMKDSSPHDHIQSFAVFGQTLGLMPQNDLFLKEFLDILACLFQ